MSKEPIIFNRFDVCPNCKQSKTELFDYFNYAIGYKDIVDNFLKGVIIPIDKRAIYTLKCRGCGNRFFIDWRLGIPIPVYYKDNWPTKAFMLQYIDSKRKN